MTIMKRGKENKKKTTTSKKKISKKKTFFTDKKLLAISISLFLIFAIALTFINTPKNASVTGYDIGDNLEGNPLDESDEIIKTDSEATSFVKDMFSKTGSLDMKIAKYLFFFMLIILIFSVLKFAKFPDNGFLQFLIALPVAFLASAYLAPEEIFTILQSYETLGIVLSFILPFIILLFFSAMLVSNEKIKHMSMPKIMLEVFLWFFFAVVLGYKIITGIVKGELPLGLNLPIIIMGSVFMLSFFILVFNRKFRNWMWKITIDMRKAKHTAMRVEAIERQKTQAALANLDDEDSNI